MKYIFIYILLFLAIGCREKYVPEFSSPPTGYLVVEGNINSGGPTIVHLSRTSPLSTVTRVREENAYVRIEGSDNKMYDLTETSSGVYQANNLELSNSTKYRLHITVKDGKDYLSQFEELKIAPPIDSISWQRLDGNGDVQFHVNAHDDQNKTQYYLWDYVETWEFHSPYLSFLKYFGDTSPGGQGAYVGYKDSVNYSFDPSMFACWRSEISTSLEIGSTAKLTQDVVFYPIARVPRRSKKMSFLYSINVRQMALSKEAFEYIEKMKKNTENTGTIFDPQPSELKGNIYCVNNPAETVLGYVSASTITEKRKFITREEIPNWGYTPNCELITIANNPDSIAVYRAWFPSEIRDVFRDNILSFSAVNTLNCIDCRVEGTNVKPDFWP
jgi:hypothetical protein